MTAESVAIGTELLLGDTVDTNSAELGRVLAKFGVFHFRRQTVGDNLDRAVEAVGLALSRADIVVTIGGLGPTEDDTTREAVAKATGRELVFDEGLAAEVRAKLESRGFRTTESQARQAWLPEGARALPNPNGTAPGIVCESAGKTVVCLPGPRSEFVPMLEGPVAELLSSYGAGEIESTTIKVAGLGESLIEDALAEFIRLEDPTVATYAKTGEVHVRVTSRAEPGGDASSKTAPVVEAVYSILSEHVYGRDGDTLESAVLDLLRKRGQTLATAESCTGGGIGSAITSVPGSSDAYLGGIVSYSNGLKAGLLGVSKETLERSGAVSEECAREMASGVRAATGADWGLSVTGIAGPDGGSDEKPVGLVFIGVSSAGGTVAHRYQFLGDRNGVRARSVVAALTRLWQALRD